MMDSLINRRAPTSGQLELSFSRRTMLIAGVQGTVGTVVAARMGYIAIFENERYKLLSESNRINLTLIPPRRGWFIDRFGKPIATNRADFRVDIIPDRLVDKDATVKTLAQLLSLNQDDIDRITREIAEAQGFQPVEVASNLDYDSFSRVSVRLPDLPGVSPRQGFSRYYPSGAAVGHLLGYVGVVSAEEYKLNKDPLLITPGFKIGKDSLEKAFEPQLRGKPGAKRTEVTARGKIVRELSTRNDTPGKPVQLAIDIDLHNFAARRLGLESGSVVVFDCLTGDILTMVSMPTVFPKASAGWNGKC
jgi:penicillin-binding protein 2